MRTVAANDSVAVPLTCPTGKKLLSATAFWVNFVDAVQVEYTSSTTATAYAAAGPESDNVVVVAVCATVA